MSDWNKQPPPQPQPQPPTYIVPTSTVPTYTVVVQTQEPEGWYKRNYKNKPQSNSVGSASLIFVSGGMSMAWNLGFQLNSTPTNLLLSWFIGAIIGAVIGAIACNYVHKKIIACFAAVLVTISGILMVSAPNSYDAITAARYINGIAVGLVFPLTFVLVGEEMVKSLRGLNAVAVDTMLFNLGIFIQITYSVNWTTNVEQNFSATQMNGVLNIFWGCISFITSFTVLIESPLYFLVRNQEEKAIDVLRRLQRPFTVTHETYEQLEEHKRYLADSQYSAIRGLPALIKLCFYRSFMALSFSYFTNYAFTYSCTVTSLYTWPYIIYGIARWIGPMFIMFTIDFRGRKPHMICGFSICCILAFVVGGIFDDKRNFIDFDYMNAVKYILIFYQLFASISIASSSAYLSEAFPLAVKSYYIAFVFIVEMLIHIIIICSAADYNIFNLLKMAEYFFTLGGLSLAFSFVATFAMPETKCNTLRECLTKFRHLFNYRP